MNVADLHRPLKLRAPGAAKIIFISLLAAFVDLSWYLGVRCDFDGHDAYVFLTQSHRLTDPAFVNVGFDATRPRGLVFGLAVYEAIFRFFRHATPNVRDYHPLMTILNALAILAWAAFARAAWGRLVGYLVGILLTVHFLIFTNSMAVLSDVPTTGLWGASLLLFFRLTQRASENRAADASVTRLALLWGFTLGWVALAKYQYFFLPPTLFAFILGFVLIFPGARGPRDFWWRTVGIAAAAWTVTIDVVQRTAGSGAAGFWYTPLLYVSYTKQLIDDTLQHEPVTVYVQNFFQSYGVLFCALFLVAAAALIGEFRKFLRARRTPDLFLSAFFVVNLFYLVFIQSIHHREARYILPMIPPLLCAAALGWQKIFDRNAKGALVGAILFLLALPHALTEERRAFTAYESYCAVRRGIDYAGFFSYLHAPAPNGIRCATVHACQTELERPEYMVRLAGLPVQVTYCHKKYGDFVEQMTTAVAPGRCFVLASSDLYGPPPVGVLVRKVMGDHLRADQKLAYETMATPPEERVRCESAPEKTFTCFADREFF